jgi:hypothetical protein
VKNKFGVALVALVIAVAWGITAREEAPISAGTFFVYDNAGMQVRLTFSPTDADHFDANLEYADSRGTFEPAQRSSASVDVVDTRMRTTDGRIFELGLLGPLWVPPSEVREGGSAHGTRVREVRRWENWNVGVVTASVGIGGALRAEWYYDERTGFLVGGRKSTAVSLPGDGQVFTLTDSNLSDLGLR